MTILKAETDQEGQAQEHREKEPITCRVWWTCKLRVSEEEFIKNFKFYTNTGAAYGPLWTSHSITVTSENGKIGILMPEDILKDHDIQCPMKMETGHIITLHAEVTTAKRQEVKPK